MDSDILKSIAAFLITAACIVGPTILEGLKRRMKAKMDAAPKVRQTRQKLSSAQPVQPAARTHDPREAMMRAAEQESSATKRDAEAPAAPAAPQARTNAVNERIAALRRAVIAAEVLQRRF